MEHLPNIAREACISDPLLLWSIILGNLAIFVAYMWIPFSVARILSSQEVIPQPLLWMLAGSFVLACGISHAVGVVVIFRGYYGLEAGVLLFTAVVSLVAAVAIHRAVDRIRLEVREFAALKDRVRLLDAELTRTRSGVPLVAGSEDC